MQNILISALFVMFGQQLLIDSSNTNVRIVYFLRPLWHILIVKHNIFRNLTLVTLGKTSKQKKLFNSGIAQITQTPPPPNSGNFTDFFPADKNDVLGVWRKKILMMIIIVAMIILIKILAILMIIMTKNTEKNLQILLILGKILPF